MKARLVGVIAVTLWMVCLGGSRATAAVNLELRPEPQTVAVGALVDIGLFAVSDDGTDQFFSAMDVVLTWDPTALELVEAIDNGPHNWNFMFGFPPDEQLDGLNDSLLDGDALFQAASFTPAAATTEGLLITTLRFTALSDTTLTQVVIDPALENITPTRVFAPGAVIVTGTLGSASVTIVGEPSLSASDVNMPAGRTANIVVSGEIVDKETFGVTILLELVPRPDATGTVTFTPAEFPEDVDIFLLGNPWGGAGTFAPIDTNNEFLLDSQNGATLDNGTLVPEPTTFSGPLMGFPVIAAPDAHGVWDVKLCALTCIGEDASLWNASPTPLLTALHEGVLTVVELGDGDGDGAIDLRDFSELQVCFTGAVGPADPPAYPSAPELRCSVYDFDDDGDVDNDDLAAFLEVMFGPAP